MRTFLFLLLTCLPLAADEAQWEKMISQLSAGSFQERNVARLRLLDAGHAAIPALTAALATPDPETRGQAKSLIRHIQLGIFNLTPRQAIPSIEAVAAATGEAQVDAFDDLLADDSIPLHSALALLLNLETPEWDLLFKNLTREVPTRPTELTLPPVVEKSSLAAKVITAWHHKPEPFTGIASALFQRFSPNDLVPQMEIHSPDRTEAAVLIFARRALAAEDPAAAQRILSAASTPASRSHLAALLHFRTGSPLEAASPFHSGDWATLLTRPIAEFTDRASTAQHLAALLHSLQTAQPTPDTINQSLLRNSHHSPLTGLEGAIARHDLRSALDFAFAVDSYPVKVGLHLAARDTAGLQQLTAHAATTHISPLGAQIPLITAPPELRVEPDFPLLFTLAETSRSRDLRALISAAARADHYDLALSQTLKAIKNERLSSQAAPAALFPDNARAARWLATLRENHADADVLDWIRSVFAGEAAPADVLPIISRILQSPAGSRDETAGLLALLQRYPDTEILKKHPTAFLQLKTTAKSRNTFSQILIQNELSEQNTLFWQAVSKQLPTDPSARYHLDQIDLAHQLPLADPAARLTLARTMISRGDDAAARQQLQFIARSGSLEHPSTITALKMLGHAAFSEKDYETAAHTLSLHAIGTLLSDQSYSSIHSYLTPATQLAIAKAHLAEKAGDADLAALWKARAAVFDPKPETEPAH